LMAVRGHDLHPSVAYFLPLPSIAAIPLGRGWDNRAPTGRHNLARLAKAVSLIAGHHLRTENQAPR